jgi:hypothetical protein
MVLLLGALAGFGSLYGSTLIDPVVLQEESSSSYFEADVPRVHTNLSDRWSNHYRTRVHPLFSLFAGTPVLILKKGLGLSPTLGIRFYIAFIACLWSATLFVTIRLLGCRILDGFVFTILAMASSAAVFWFIVPETYSFGSLSILWAILFAALSQRRNLSGWIAVGVSALTLAFTVTNWMAGILATAVTHSWRKTLNISYRALAVVIVLWGVQKGIYPTAEFFSGREETRYILREDSGGPARVMGSFLYHSMVMPEIGVVDRYDRPEWPIMITQMSAPGSGSVYGLAAVAWSGLLVLGVWASFTSPAPVAVRILIGLILLGQIGLHLLYGEETFLYVLHFTPIMVLLASLSCLTRFRRSAVVLAAFTAVLALVNNVGRLEEVVAFYQQHGSERHKVRAQMNLRPDDPWPRGEGHVILAMPGSREEEKGYHEPGGGFSPSVGSFGLSLWVLNGRGELVDTSDRIPLTEVGQRFVAGGLLPSIETGTRYYHTNTTLLGSGRSLLRVSPLQEDLDMVAVVRSVGPAGGPVHSMEWDGEILLIDGRWEIRFSPGPADVLLGKEGGDWVSRNEGPRVRVSDHSGWCYARCRLVTRKPTSVLISDRSFRMAKGTESISAMRPSFRADLPDPRFMACIEAQILHLRMGMVEGETRPGDPMNYPLEWPRDGSYIISSLASAGLMEEARDLSVSLAHHDFFGGFGSEADAPGLALWGLEEVAGRARDPEFDRLLWPHVRRKAKLIEAMLSNTKPLFMPYKGQLVPDLLEKLKSGHSICRGYGPLWPMMVAEPARDGLISGKMDNHFPVLFVNAVNYRGLLSAAAMADRLGRHADAARWRAHALRTEKAWDLALTRERAMNERTYACGLWPTRIAVHAKEKFHQDLGQRWDRDRNPDGTYKRVPLYTYFDLAETHQWLFLDRPDRVWKSLEWFWENQSSPGLFTWWEGEGETNSYHLWQKVRGWVAPRTVTPHYWTAAEMLLLQMDMLAYAADGMDEVVIGAGIPKEWVPHPMSVEGMTLPGFRLSWSWDTETMRVETEGKKLKVRLGPSFPEHAPVRLIHTPAPNPYRPALRTGSSPPGGR